MSTCTKCGNVGKPGEKFCLVCGNPFPVQAPVQQGMPGMAPMGQPNNYGASMGQPMQNYGAPMGQQPVNRKPASSKGANKGLIIGIASAVAVIAVAAVLYFSGIFGKSETVEDAMDRFCNAIQDQDEELFYESMDESVTGVIEALNDVSDYNGDNQLFEEIIEDMERSVGDIEEVTYKIKDQDDIDADDIIDKLFNGMDVSDLKKQYKKNKSQLDDEQQEITEKMINEMEALPESLEDADELVSIEVKVTVKGDDGKDSDTMNMIAVRRGKSWKLIPANLNF